MLQQQSVVEIEMQLTDKNRLKFLLFLVGLGGMIPLALLGVRLIAQFITYFQQGADPASIFHGHALVIPAPEDARWLSFEDVTGVMPTQGQQEELLSAYWMAWQALSRAHQTGDITDLATYWAGAAYDQAQAAVNSAQRRAFIHTAHQLKLTFFSEDGSIAAFEDTGFTWEQTPNSGPVTLSASAAVVMTLDQGFWRIRQITLTFRR